VKYLKKEVEALNDSILKEKFIRYANSLIDSLNVNKEFYIYHPEREADKIDERLRKKYGVDQKNINFDDEVLSIAKEIEDYLFSKRK